MSVTTAIILAGGFGTRLRTVVNDLPKPMAHVRGLPFLQFQLRELEKQMVKTVVLSTGYLGEKIKTFFGARFGNIDIQYSHEEQPLGTGGAIKQALEKCKDEVVLVLNGDSMFEIDLSIFQMLHERERADCSIALRLVNDGARYGRISLDTHYNVIGFSEKSADFGAVLINGGVYLLNRSAFLAQCPSTSAFSIEKDYFEKMAGKNKLKGFPFDGYFIDIGIPADYERAQHEFERFEH